MLGPMLRERGRSEYTRVSHLGVRANGGWRLDAGSGKDEKVRREEGSGLGLNPCISLGGGVKCWGQQLGEMIGSQLRGGRGLYRGELPASAMG